MICCLSSSADPGMFLRLLWIEAFSLTSCGGVTGRPGPPPPEDLLLRACRGDPLLPLDAGLDRGTRKELL